MKKFSLLIFFIIIIIALFYTGLHIRWMRLFSPGDLSHAHANFDKEGKCDACHTSGKRLDDKKCFRWVQVDGLWRFDPDDNYSEPDESLVYFDKAYVDDVIKSEFMYLIMSKVFLSYL